MAQAKKLGTKVDACFRQRLKCDEIASKLSKEKQKLEDMKEALLLELQTQDVSKMSGQLANVSVSHKDLPNITDWDKLYGYIKRKGAFELLHRRVSVVAWREHCDDPKNRQHRIPGVENFIKVDLSLTKKRST